MTMLDRMRRHKNWLKWSLALVVLTFIIFYIPDFLSPQTTSAGAAAPGELVANVEGHQLTAADFQRRYLAQIDSYRASYGAGLSDALLKQLGIDQQILQQMIDEQAALAEAERQGIRVSDEELAQTIFSIPGLQENGKFIGEQRYEQLLRSQRVPLTKATFEGDLRRSMMIDKLRAALTDWMAVSDGELEREYKKRNEKVKLQVIALTADRFRDKVTVSDADVAAYFEAHKPEYRIGEQRKVKYLLLDRAQMRAKTVITPAEIQQFYNNNIQDYQSPEQVRASHILLKTEGKDEAAVRKQAEDLVKQIKAGADFAELAKKLSEDEGSKANGGDLDYFSRGRMVPEFENAVFSMQPGQLSDPIKTQYGFHIIKLVDKKPMTTRPLDEVRGQIQDQLQSQRVERLLADRATELDTKIDDLADMEQVAKDSGLTVQESSFFGREDPVPGVGPAPQVATAAFTLKDNEVSTALGSPAGPVFIAVTGKKDPYVPKFEEVKDKVREDVTLARAAEMSLQRARALASTLRASKNVVATAKAEGFEAKDTDLIARGAPLPDIGARPEVDEVVFALPANAVSDPIALKDGSVIVRVVERDEVTPQEWSQDKDTFRAQLLNERRARFFSAYMNRAKQRMKIEVRNDVVRRVVDPVAGV